MAHLRILGLSCAIFLRCKRLQTLNIANNAVSHKLCQLREQLTMNAFIGRLMWSSRGFFISDDDVSRLKIVLLLEKNCFKNEVRFNWLVQVTLTRWRRHCWAIRSAAGDGGGSSSAIVTAGPAASALAAASGPVAASGGGDSMTK